MALKVKINDVEFGVGDEIRVQQKIQESADKVRLQTFEGSVIGIKGSGNGKSFTIRRVGSANVGIEKIFPINTPIIDTIEVVRRGTKGIRQSKLYYTRDKSRKEIEKIYSRNTRREKAKEESKVKVVKKSK